MLISLNELKKLVKINVSDDELFKLIGSRLVEIEHVEDLAPKYKKIYVVKVNSAEPIEGTHLHLCQIDAGKKLNAEVDPEHKDYIQVVCGAPNVKKGMLAAWIAPGAIVPSTFGTDEPFEISARPLRGFKSYGMLAAADELALGEDHEGIIELNPESAKPGDLLADALDLNDKIIEVENKSLTHRPDCFGIWGFAREVAGILGQSYHAPRMAQVDAWPKDEIISIESSDICPCYTCAIISLENPLEKSPYFDYNATFLAKAGMHTISKIVDITNTYMLLTGQPLHAFDYDKFLKVGGTDEPKINVRLARKGEKLVLLDGKEVSLVPTDILICSNDKPVALGGAMGGESTMIDETTRRVILESATFSLYNLRKTQMAHGIFSEAITRFTKGQPIINCEPVMLAAAQEIANLSDSSKVDFVARKCMVPLPLEKVVVTLSVSDINNLLGTSYSLELIKDTLENTGFKVEAKGEDLAVSAPLWRTDIHIKEDVVEEIGRLLGFDNIPLNYPLRPFVCPEVDSMLTLKSNLRTCLSDRLGANELLTYSFVSKALQEKAGEDPSDSYQIINSISPELECFRQSLAPSLLEKMHDNEKAGYNNFTLYELNQVSKKSWGLTEENVPKMETELGLVTHGDFYAVKHILAELTKSLGMAFELKPLKESHILEPLHAVAIYSENEKIGELGEVKQSVLKRFKLSQIVSALSLSLDPCLNNKAERKIGIKLSKFPYVSRDLTFRVTKGTKFAIIESKIKEVLSSLSDILYILEPVSIFSKKMSDTKNLSFHLELTHTKKTLDGKEISDIIDSIVKQLSALGAEVV
ncbi:phenylalanine--tRNA ligase subunit beta [Candidatus Saccharibacteria bacterium]|nr:phenylalanine--tRNA ligase subunit beta [Candidatus Saccharibacteria bacterium]